MPSTSFVDFDHGLREIQGRTDSAGVDIDDLPLIEDRSINAILSEGYLSGPDAFAVSADSPASMNVIVGSGVALQDLFVVEGDDDGQWPYLVSMTAAQVTVTLDASDASLSRVDEIWLVVQDRNHDASSNGLARIAYRKGDAGGGSPGPDASWKAAVRLASVTVGATVSAVESGDIADTRSAATLKDGTGTVWTGGNDGPGSGLDADTVDGVHAAALAKLAGGTFTGLVTFADGLEGSLGTDVFGQGHTPSDWPDGMSWQFLNGGRNWSPLSNVDASVFMFNFGSSTGTWQMHVNAVSGGQPPALSVRRWSASGWTSWNTVATVQNPGQWEVDNSTEVASPVSLTGSYATVASVSIPIPSDWTAWKCFTHATYCLTTTGGATDTVNTKTVIDGTDQQPQAGVRVVPSERSSNAIAARRTGMSTTGSRTVSLQMQAAIPDTTVDDIFLYARAVRTS